MASSEERSDTIEIDSNIKELSKSANNEKNLCLNNENNNLNTKNGLNNDKYGEKVEISNNDEVFMNQSTNKTYTIAVNDRPISSVKTDKTMINTESVSGTSEIKKSHKITSSSSLTSSSSKTSIDAVIHERDRSHVRPIPKPNPTAVSQGICYGNINQTVVISTQSRDDRKREKRSKSRDNGKYQFLYIQICFDYSLIIQIFIIHRFTKP